jgi:hypothetical protein
MLHLLAVSLASSDAASHWEQPLEKTMRQKASAPTIALFHTFLISDTSPHQALFPEPASSFENLIYF